MLMQAADIEPVICLNKCDLPLSAADEAEFDDFVSSCKSLSLYDTGITPQYGDKLICLSTCEYTRTNGRLVVAAVRD